MRSAKKSHLTPDNRLLFLLNLLDNLDVYLQDIGHGVSRGKGEPLRQRDIGYAVALVEFEINHLLCVRCVLDIVTTVIGEDSSVTSGEVEGAGFGVTNENSGAGVSLVEVQPFLGL